MIVKEKAVVTTTYEMDKAEFEGFLFGRRSFELPENSTWYLQTNNVNFNLTITTTNVSEYEA